MTYEVSKLADVFYSHGNIIVGVDFDDTIFNYTGDGYTEERCIKVVELLRSLKKYITLCLYTVADDQSLKYKTYIMEQLDIKPDYINCSPLNLGNGQKPYFNLLLDDKAGLNETIKILTEFKKEII